MRYTALVLPLFLLSAFLNGCFLVAAAPLLVGAGAGTVLAGAAGPAVVAGVGAGVGAATSKSQRRVHTFPRKRKQSNSDEASSLGLPLQAASSGTGFAVSFGGHIVTNNFVIKGCNDVKLLNEGELLDIAVLSQDKENDLALLKANFTPQNVFVVSPNEPRLNQEVFISGFSLGYPSDTRLVVTPGTISSLGKVGEGPSQMQIDAVLQSGNSGAPVYDELGNLLAVATVGLDRKILEEQGALTRSVSDDVNFGIKAKYVSSLLFKHAVPKPSASTKAVTGGKEKATFFLSCLMSEEQISEMGSQRAMVNDSKK